LRNGFALTHGLSPFAQADAVLLVLFNTVLEERHVAGAVARRLSAVR